MPTVKDNAVCLRRLDWSETSQIVVLLTESHGKVSATAKGAKRQTPSSMAKFSGGVDLLTAAEAVLIIRRGVDLANLVEWDLLDAHWHLRRRLGAHAAAMYAADLVHHLVHDHDPHPQTYGALRRLLADLAEPDRDAASLLAFQWAVVEDLGYRPILDRDAQTGAPVPADADVLAFSPTAGGVVADTRASDRWRLRRTTLNVLCAAADGADPAVLDAEAVGRANRLLCVYFRELIGRHLPTMDAVLGAEDPANPRDVV